MPADFGFGHDGRRRGLEIVAYGLCALQYLFTPVLVGVDDAEEELLEGGHAARRDGREVRAAIEGGPVGGEEDGHRPAAVPGEGLDGGHVDGVDVGSFLAVYLYVHEVLVHHARGLIVLEGLALHDVAPVARAVADREKDGFVFLTRPLQRLLAPGVPVHGVVLVLEQIRARLIRQPVSHSLSPPETGPSRLL